MIRCPLRALLIAASFLLLQDAAPAAPPSNAPSQTPFLFGCDWPEDGSPAVKSLFYETGCNFARLTGGGYSWSLDSHRRAIRELDSHGVKVLLQLGSHYPSADYFSLKDSYLVDQKGETGKEDRTVWAITYSGSAWPQYSYASSAFRAKLNGDFTAYLSAFKDNQSDIAALLLHNEAGYHWIDDRVFDYNPQAISRFHDWLKQQHGDIATLNRRWGTTYASFDAVDPPRDLPPVANMAAWLDWRRFNADLIEDFLDREVALAHRAMPGVPATTNLSGPLDNWYPIRLADNYRYTAGFDVAGIDIYPSQWTSPVFPGYAMDMTRGAAQGKKIIVDESEVFDPSHFAGLSEDQRAGMLRSMVWTFIGHGADGVLLWSLDGQGGFHLTDGEFNARVAAVREIAHLAPMLHVTAFHKPEARIAICVDQDSYLYYGGLASKLERAGHAELAARGLYSAVVGGQYQANVVSASQIRQGLGKRYRVLLLSLPILMDETLAEQLRAFVAGGGLLIAEAPCAERDRWGNPLAAEPGFGLDDLLGIRGERTGQPAGDSGAVDITTPSGVFAGQGRVEFQLAGAKKIGSFPDGAPAVTVHRYGKGEALFIAAEVGVPNASPWDSAIGATPGLRSFMSSTIERYVSIAPTARLAYLGSPYLDASFRDDSRGNKLIVLADSTNQAKPLPPATQVTLTLTAQNTPSSVQAFEFLPPRSQAGRTVAGPQPMPIERDRAGRPILALPQIDSALPLLLANDFSPLLTIDSPTSAAVGSEVEVRLTCYNPSPKPIRTYAELTLPSAWTALAAPGSQLMTIPARGSRVIALRARSGGGERVVISAQLSYRAANGIEGHVASVPADIFAGSAMAQAGRLDRR